MYPKFRMYESSKKSICPQIYTNLHEFNFLNFSNIKQNKIYTNV